MNLPVLNYEQLICDTVSKNRVTIIQAETGAGKSTKVPQMLYNAGYTNIKVTQPRVMAAISLATRVAEEIGEEVGKTVGYKTRFYKTKGYTPITYVPDGYLLSTYNEEKISEGIIILDEAHEFNINQETLLGLYKKKLETDNNLKIVVMSATIDSKKFSNFFDGAPVINVPGKVYPVEKLWEPTMSIEDCIYEYFNPGTNMLVFLPGKEEISNVFESISRTYSTGSTLPQIFQLHGEMSYTEQKKVFDHYENGKIILATNVAQTSITVPDVDFVIDTGTCKQMLVKDGISRLTVVNVSHADCTQRAGRAGRCKPGKYVLCSSTDLGHRPEFSIPEIQRISLENLVLKLATLNIDPIDIDFIHQPDRNNIKLAKELLIKLDAINEDGSITKLGIEMESMPVSARIARMLLEARKYSPEVQGDIAIIAALVECGDFRGKDFGWYTSVPDCTNECKMSDLTYQLHVTKYINSMWHAASAEEKKDFFKNHHVKYKIYQNVLKVSKDIADKLSLKYMLYNETAEENYKSIRNCIIPAYIDCLYVFDGFYRNSITYRAIDGQPRDMVKNSVFANSWATCPNFIIGQPFDIEIKGFYGPRTISLVKNATFIENIEDYPNVVDSFMDIASTKYRYDKTLNRVSKSWYVGNVTLKTELLDKTPTLESEEGLFGNKIVTVYLEGEYITTISM